MRDATTCRALQAWDVHTQKCQNGVGD
eukprot:COSAG01_NODE_38221_length_492_cov_1.310433_2_plen_26_part_01